MFSNVENEGILYPGHQTMITKDCKYSHLISYWLPRVFSYNMEQLIYNFGLSGTFFFYTTVFSFFNLFKQIGDLNVTGLIDGVNLGVDDVLLTSRNQTVEGNLTFSKTVRFGDDVRVDGAVNGTDISDLEEISVFKNKTHFIEGKFNVHNISS